MADSPQNLPNPVIKESDAEGDALRALARQADASGIELGSDTSQSQLPTPVPAPEPAPEPAAKPAEAPVAEKPRDELGRFTKSDGTKSEPNEPEPTPEVKPAETKPESDFEKKKKELERRDRSWKALEEEKTRVRAEQAQFEAHRRAFEQQRQQPPKQEGFTSAQYSEAAKDFRRLAKQQRANGDHEQADANELLAEKAETARDAAHDTEQKQQFESQKSGFEQLWKSNADKVVSEVPDLGNPTSDLSKEMQQLFQEEPLFNYHPDGLRKAYEILQLRKQGARVTELETKLAEVIAERDDLRKKTAIGGDGPTKQVGEKRFEDMSLDEMSRHLRQQAASAGEMAA